VAYASSLRFLPRKLEAYATYLSSVSKSVANPKNVNNNFRSTTKEIAEFLFRLILF